MGPVEGVTSNDYRSSLVETFYLGMFVRILLGVKSQSIITASWIFFLIHTFVWCDVHRCNAKLAWISLKMHKVDCSGGPKTEDSKARSLSLSPTLHSICIPVSWHAFFFLAKCPRRQTGALQKLLAISSYGTLMFGITRTVGWEMSAWQCVPF